MKFLKGIWHRSDKEQKEKQKKKDYTKNAAYFPPATVVPCRSLEKLTFLSRSLTTHTRPPNKNVSCRSLAPESTERRKDFNKHSVRQRLLATGSSESSRDGITASGGKRALNLIDRERDRIKKNPDFNLFAGRNTRLRLFPPRNSRIISLACDRFEEARSPTLLNRKSY